VLSFEFIFFRDGTVQADVDNIIPLRLLIAWAFH
jgi:hypothetical protein